MLFNLPRAHECMNSKSIDALVASTPKNFFYASEYWNSVSEFQFLESFFAAVIPAAEGTPACLVIPESQIGGLLSHPTWVPHLRPIEFLNTSHIGRAPELVRREPFQSHVENLVRDKVVADLAPNLIAGVVEALADMGLSDGMVAFDDLRIAHHVQGLLPALRVVDGHDLLIDIRKVKTHDEIARLRQGACINEDAVMHVLPHAVPGRRWSDLARAFRHYVDDRGATLMAPEKALQFGTEYEGEYYPDVMVGSTDDWIIRGDQPIIFETWGTYKGYKFDFSRTVFPGTPAKGYVDLCRKLDDAWIHGVEALLGPGVSTEDLFHAAIKVVYDGDIPTPKKTLPFFHGIGLDIIEQPAPFPAYGEIKPWTLEPGVVINCELLYFGHTVAPFHIESTFLITEDGAECFQTMNTDLLVLGHHS